MAFLVMRFILLVRLIPISRSFITVRSHDLEELVAGRDHTNIRLRIAKSIRENDSQIAVRDVVVGNLRTVSSPDIEPAITPLFPFPQFERQVLSVSGPRRESDDVIVVSFGKDAGSGLLVLVKQVESRLQPPVFRHLRDGWSQVGDDVIFTDVESFPDADATGSQRHARGHYQHLQDLNRFGYHYRFPRRYSR